MSALPKPYYEADGITLYHSDCVPILATLDPARVLVIADPPYGVDAVVRGRTFGTSNACATNAYAPIIGDSDPYNPAPLLRFGRVVAWGANHYSERLPSSPTWLIWDKRDGTESNPLADCEMAWSNCGGPARLFSHRWMGMIRDSERERRVHPTQKPVALAKWIISRYARPGDTIVEPYMGSGFAVVAAKQLGYQAIGCELAEPYLQTVVKRLSQRVLDFGVK